MNGQGPKRIVYLLGAGATQAEVAFLGAAHVNVLMRDNDWGEGVATRVLKRLSKRWRSAFVEDHESDIEKLISLLVAGGVQEFSAVAERIRKLYYYEIRNGLATADVLKEPRLSIALFQMHNNSSYAGAVERLSGVITTNHDGLLQVAEQAVLGGLNLGFGFSSTQFDCGKRGSTPPILSLHGSFTWRFALPPRVEQLHRSLAYSTDTLWIPPTILKESRSYPFNKLTGLAYELLAKNCDVLRVVGSSLAQNDWNILSMIFNAQRHLEFTDEGAFQIELITGHETGEAIAKECSYLKNMNAIGYLTEGEFWPYKDPMTIRPEMRNAFAYWLKQKILFHRARGELGDELPLEMAFVLGEGDEAQG